MSRDPFSKVTPGERLTAIPAQTWNSFIDAAQDYKRRSAKGEAANTLGSTNQPGLVWVRNDSGSDVSRFGVLGINAFVFDPGTAAAVEEFQNQPIISGVAPVASSWRKFVILQEPVPAGEIGRGMISGITPVQINMIDAGDDFAECLTSDTAKLQSGPVGSCEILQKQGGTGVVWAYVKIGVPGSQIAIGKTAAQINKGASGTVNVYRGTTKGSETFAPGDTISAYARLSSVASGAWVLCEWVQGGWEIVSNPTQVYTGSSSAIVLAGTSGTFTLGGGAGTVSASVPLGLCLASTNYQIAQDNQGNWYVLNPHQSCFVQFSNGATVAGNSATATIYAGTIGSESSSGVTISPFVRSGICVGSKTYEAQYTTGGWEIAEPDLICFAQFSSVAVAGGSATATIWNGTIGSESAASPTTTVSAYIRDGIVLTGETYTLEYTAGGWQVADPDLTFFAQLQSTTTPVVASGTATFYIFSGTTDAETSTSVAVTANIRYGVCVPNKTYRITHAAGNARAQFEVEEADTIVYGQVASDIAAGGSGSFTIYLSGSSSGVSLGTIRNDTSCTIKAGKPAYAEFVKSSPSGAAWIGGVFANQ